ncbi:MAG TPA: hypothetical protein VIY54_00765 [Steroidobacteraceae bacterium]
MRMLPRPWLLAAALAPLQANAADVNAGPPTALSVSLYRAGTRAAEALELDRLRGFALVSERRQVRLPAGESRIRFGGVADGIEPASTIITGLPAGVLEKNEDAQLLSPAALVAQMLGREVVLVRTQPRTGVVTRSPGRIRSATDGIVFESTEGIEALRCSGLPETFSFSAATELSATPTLSVLVRSGAPATATITLSYLAHGFDWTADYVAHLSPDGTTMDLGAWVTLANANAVSFPSAQAQVIAGRLDRYADRDVAVPVAKPIIAQCWPRGTTTDVAAASSLANGAPPYRLEQSIGIADVRDMPVAPASIARLVEEEQLGDLKLYRVPQRTTLTSRQIKQVRLLEQAGVPVQLIYGADLVANQDRPWLTAAKTLRTKNDKAHHLGLALPSGRVASFLSRGNTLLLLAQAPLRDIAVGEQFEIGVGESADVQLRSTRGPDAVNRVEIHNARSSALAFELRLRLDPGSQLIAADHPVRTRHGQPVFEVQLPAEGHAIVRYQTGQPRQH